MLIELIKQDRIQAMKDKDTIKKDVLSTLIGESSKEEKIPSDEKVIATIKKFVKNAQELQVNIANSQGNQSHINKAQLEINILNDYLPKQLNENEIDFHIKRAITEARVGKVVDYKPNLGEIMKYFKLHLAGLYDGNVVSKVAKDHL